MVFVACLIPLARLGWLFWSDALGANPIEHVTRSTGWWALSFLVLTLAVTPFRHGLGFPWLLRFRRMLGLFALAYGLCHLATYVWLDQFFDWSGIGADIVKRPFITIGVLTLSLMLPLGATSTAAMVRRLGARRWLALHRSIYVIGLLAVSHFWWLVKKDITEPASFAAILAVLLVWRVRFAWVGSGSGSGRGDGQAAQSRPAARSET